MIKLTIEEVIASKTNACPKAVQQLREEYDSYLACFQDCVENGNGDLFSLWHDCHDLHGFLLEKMVNFLGHQEN